MIEFRRISDSGHQASSFFQIAVEEVGCPAVDDEPVAVEQEPVDVVNEVEFLKDDITFPAKSSHQVDARLKGHIPVVVAVDYQHR